MEEAIVPGSPQPTQTEHTEIPVSSKRTVWMWFLVLGVVLTVVALGFVYYFYFYRYSEKNTLSLIRNTILPATVQVRCLGKDGEEYAIGSGIYYKVNGTPVVATNSHVVLASDNKFYGCNVYFPRPEDGTFYSAAYKADLADMYYDKESVINGSKVEGLDYAVLTLTEPYSDPNGVAYPFPPTQKDPYEVIGKMCKPKPVSIGDRVYIVGYPGVGQESITLTEGVVSGFTGDSDEWIKVSANTNHGNSGGIAISPDNLCMYGIPTRASMDPGANLGFILSSSYISSFLTGLTGKLTYSPPSSTSTENVLPNVYDFSDFTLQYPAEWTVSTSSDEGVYGTYFTSPDEHIFDNFDENVSVLSASNEPKSFFDQTVQSEKKDYLTADDKTAKASYSTRQGIKIFHMENTVASEFSTVLFLRDIFWYKGTLYIIKGVIGTDGPNADAYEKIVSDTLNSLQFK